MDIDRKLNEIDEQEKYGAIIIDLTTKLHTIEKNLKDFEFEVANCMKEGRNVEIQLIDAQIQAQITRKQLENARNDVFDCIEMVIVEENELDKTRQEYWCEVNKYIDTVNEYLLKDKGGKCVNKKNATNKAELEIKGQMDALEMYKMYQQNKIKYMLNLKNDFQIN